MVALESQIINWKSLEFNAMALNDNGVNMTELLSFFSNSDINILCFNFTKIYCIMSVGRHILDCKLAINVNCFDEIRHNGERNRSDVTSFDRLKCCCHHNLRNMFRQMMHGRN